MIRNCQHLGLDDVIVGDHRLHATREQREESESDVYRFTDKVITLVGLDY